MCYNYTIMPKLTPSQKEVAQAVASSAMEGQKDALLAVLPEFYRLLAESPVLSGSIARDLLMLFPSFTGKEANRCVALLKDEVPIVAALPGGLMMTGESFLQEVSEEQKRSEAVLRSAEKQLGQSQDKRTVEGMEHFFNAS